MSKLFGNKKLFILLFGLIVFIAIMGLTLSNQDQLTENQSWPVKFLKDSVTWTQGLLYRPAIAVGGFIHDIRHLNQVYEENKALHRTIAQYTRDRARLNMLELENERYKEALAFTERQKEHNRYRYHIAHVVSVSPDPFNQTIRINLGAQDGIKKDWVVTTTKGMIGRVISVEEFHATVQLITNIDDRGTDKAISATVLGKESDTFGMIESYDRNEGLLLMTRIEQSDPIEKDDIVITSGLGGVFPEGIVIGKVVEREVGEFGITHTAKVQPLSEFTQLREVFVIEVPGM